MPLILAFRDCIQNDILKLHLWTIMVKMYYVMRYTCIPSLTLGNYLMSKNVKVGSDQLLLSIINIKLNKIYCKTVWILKWKQENERSDCIDIMLLLGTDVNCIIY